MNYKVFIIAPDEEYLITAIIAAASEAGAGQIGNYSRCAFVQKGWGQWQTGENATPYHGAVGEIARLDQVKIEMRCPATCAGEVVRAVKRVHPFEEPTIDIIPLVDVE